MSKVINIYQKISPKVWFLFITGIVLLLGSFLYGKGFLQKSEYRILTLGEDAPNIEPKRWPEFLEPLLNDNDKGIRFKVINGGHQGNHSTTIVANLEENLKKYKPDIVVVMMGINDTSAPHLFVKYEQRFGNKHQTSSLKPQARGVVHAQGPEDSNYYVGQGRDFEARGRFEEAISAFKEALRLNPQNEEAYLGIAQVYRRQNQYEKSLEMYQKALELNPDNEWAYEGVGSTYRGLGQFAQAVEMYKKAIELNPNYFMLYLVTAQALREQKDYKQAEDFYLKAINTDSNNDFPKIWLSRLYRETERAGEAEKMLLEVIRKRERFEEEVKEADRLREQKRYEEAERVYKAVTQTSPQNYVAYTKLGFLYGEMGRDDDARAILNEAIKVNFAADYPAFPYSELSRVYRRMGQAEKAVENEKKVLELGPTAGNYRRIKEVLEEKGMRLVAVQYPLRDVEQLKEMLGFDEDVVYVDNRQVFEDALKDSSYNDYFLDREFGDFGHPTEKGSRLMAQNISEYIKRALLK